MNHNRIATLLTWKKLTVTLFIIWTLVTLFLTLIPGRYIPHSGIFSYDKLGHTCLLFAWTYLLGLTMVDGHDLDFSLILLMTMIGIMFGGLIEILQYVLPVRRDADFFDFMADFVGCMIAFIGLLVSRRYISE